MLSIDNFVQLWLNMSECRHNTDREKSKYMEKSCFSTTFSTTNPTPNYMGFKPCHLGETPSTNRLNHGLCSHKQKLRP